MDLTIVEFLKMKLKSKYIVQIIIDMAITNAINSIPKAKTFKIKKEYYKTTRYDNGNLYKRSAFMCLLNRAFLIEYRTPKEHLNLEKKHENNERKHYYERRDIHNMYYDTVVQCIAYDGKTYSIYRSRSDVLNYYGSHIKRRDYIYKT